MEGGGMIRSLILASSSPRRKELLQGLNLPFQTHPSEEDESVPTGTAPREMVEMLSLRKAKSVASLYGEGLVIGSDTIVVCDRLILGKPRDEDDSARMLSLIQGRSHFVYTGVAIVEAGTGRSSVAHSKTEVFVKPMDKDKIRRYIQTGEPNDKAGSYAIQGIGATLVEKIDGDYFTVVGLPVGLLAEMLEKYGISVI
ncbi:Maf family protein [Cohnella nanjingensis]|uniref:dTTP/UTP pyrophosphatase n=1 Tax=Cohnella nanjingensis TaxID=1387779 RepID=A0A7X0RV39_9BACL|nr:Maf family protein [Cohnella nanjingensis]MBB6674238.1 septum formation protein Maf [Cohnella nanjingensis]